MIKRFSIFACAVMTLLAPPVVFAQSYPNKAIRIIVPFAAGASNDIVARLIAPRLSEGLGQTVTFMENETRKWGRVVRAANIKAE